MASLFEFYMYTYVIVEFGWSIKNIKKKGYENVSKKIYKRKNGGDKQ